MTKRTPVRTCVGCQKKKSKFDLVRLILDEEGAVSIDHTGKAHGRGAYLCQDQACLEEAIKRRSLSKAFRKEVKLESVSGLRLGSESLGSKERGEDR